MADDSSHLVEGSQPTKVEKCNSEGNIAAKGTAKSKGVRSVPHYLRASSGSCHDACKYGKAHEFVKTPRPPIRRRPNAEIPVEIYTPDQKRSAKEAQAIKPDASSLPRLSPSSSSPPSPSPSGDISMSAKLKTSGPRKSPSSVTSKSVRQGVTSQTKTPSPGTSKSNRQGVTSEMKALSSSTSKSVRQGVTSQTKIPSPSTSKSVRQGLTSQMKAPSPSSSKSATELHLKSSPSSSSESIKQGMSSGASSGSPTVKPLASSSFRSPVSKASNMIKPKVPIPSHKLFSPGPSDPMKPSEGKSLRYSSGESSASTSGSLKSRSATVNPTASSSKGVTVARNGGGKTGTLSVPRVATKKIPTPTTSRLSPRTKVISQPPANRASRSSASVVSSILRTKSASKNVQKKVIQSDGSQENEGTSKDQISTGHSDANELVGKRTPEKTLHVIKVETDCQTTISVEDGAQIMQSQLVLSPGSLNSVSHSNSPSFSSNGAVESNSDSEYTYGSESDGSASEYVDDVEGDGSNVTDGEQLGKTGNSRMLSSEENQSRPTKLKFRRGKVVDPKYDASAPPRRLKFRRRKALTNDQGVSTGSHRRSKVKVVDTGKAADEDPVGEKVVLRHQDAQAKKNEQGLFNNVIEETATKLAETRKSKVKALVGAFETVISLQEGKPSGDKPSPHSSPGR